MENILNDEMAKYNATKPDLSNIGHNPFTVSLTIYARKIASDSFVKVKDKDMEGNDVELWMSKENDYEYESFTKLFKRAEHRKVATSLTDRGQRMYLWILYTIKSSEDIIWINREMYKEENKINSDTTYYNSIIDLESKSIIQKTRLKDVFWINPIFFFYGNRLEKYAEKVILK